MSMKRLILVIVPVAFLACLIVPTAAQAEEKLSALQTALSSTTISGYVNTSAHWDVGTGNGYVPPPSPLARPFARALRPAPLPPPRMRLIPRSGASFPSSPPRRAAFRFRQ